MQINLTFNSLAELDEFVAHHVKTKAAQTTAAVSPAPKEVKADAPKEPKAETPKEPKTPKAPAAPKEESKDDVAPIEYNRDIAPRVLKLAEAKGREVAVATLAKFNVTKAPQLKPEDYAAFVAAVDAKLAEED